MVRFKATIKKYLNKGEKTGWSVIEIEAAIAEKIFPENKKAFRVKGRLDKVPFEWVSLLPMGEGDFIMAINANMRKALKKQKDALVSVEMERDLQEKKLSDDFVLCLEDAPAALKTFNAFPKSHQRYFSNWIESAKTEATKTKRIAQAIHALGQGFGFGEMMRMNKSSKEKQ